MSRLTSAQRQLVRFSQVTPKDRPYVLFEIIRSATDHRQWWYRWKGLNGEIRMNSELVTDLRTCEKGAHDLMECGARVKVVYRDEVERIIRM
jgi:hypothetical protein